MTEELKIKLSNRDKPTLEALFLEINPYLKRVLASKGLFDDASDDVICETWLTFLSKIESYEGRSSVKTYLTGIMFHKIQEHYRTTNRHFLPEEDLTSIIDEQFTPEGWWKQEPQDPSHLFEQKEVGPLIKKCLEGLTAQQRDAFILKELEEEESDSICSSLGITISNLGVLIFRAKDKLKKCLEGSFASNSLKHGL